MASGNACTKFIFDLTFINIGLEEQPLVIMGAIPFAAICKEASETLNYRMTTLVSKH